MRKKNPYLYISEGDRLNNAGKPAEAANFYKKYMEVNPDNDVSDFLQLGIYYYRTANQYSKETAVAAKASAKDESKTGNDIHQSGTDHPSALMSRVAQYVSLADEAFNKVIELAPNSYQGYY